jgi:hypothetical protein
MNRRNPPRPGRSTTPKPTPAARRTPTTEHDDRTHGAHNAERRGGQVSHADPHVANPRLAERPVGTRIETATTRHGHGTASYDETEQYRYRLSRTWSDGRRVCFVMLNPSTATAAELDPTVTRCHRYALAWKYTQLEVVNLFALRSTDPRKLNRHRDPIGPGNDEAILAAADDADLVVCAWGTHGEHLERGRHVRALLEEHGVRLHALRLTKDGHPGHPLYLPGDLRPKRW